MTSIIIDADGGDHVEVLHMSAAQTSGHETKKPFSDFLDATINSCCSNRHDDVFKTQCGKVPLNEDYYASRWDGHLPLSPMPEEKRDATPFKKFTRRKSVR